MANTVAMTDEKYEAMQAKIERLTAEIERLRAALKQIADYEIEEFGVDCNRNQRAIALGAINQQSTGRD